MAQPAPEDYSSVFRRLIGRSVTLALEDVMRPGWRLAPEKRAQLLFALANMLHLPTAWPSALPLLAALAPRLEQAGLREDWLGYLEHGIACCAISGDQQTAACLTLERGVLLERLGRLSEAQACLAEAIARFVALRDRRGEAKARNRLAYVLRGRQLSAAAAQHVDYALQLLDPADAEALYSCMVLGLLAYDRRDWETAEQHLRACVDGWRGGEERRLYAMSLINLAAVYMRTESFAQSRECLDSAVGLLAAIGDTANEALVHLNMGVACLFLRQPQAAVAELLAAEEVFRALQDVQRLALIYSNLALAYAELGEHQAAERHFEAALQRFAALEDHPNWIDTLLDLAELRLQRRQPQAALACAQQAEVLQTCIEHDSVRAFYAARIQVVRAAADALIQNVPGAFKAPGTLNEHQVQPTGRA